VNDMWYRTSKKKPYGSVKAIKTHKQFRKKAYAFGQKKTNHTGFVHSTHNMYYRERRYRR
jgi:hypothetical protein